MGTNFYAKRIPTEKEYEEMKLLLMQKEFLKLQELIHKSTVSYHIGKRSLGWAFAFQAKNPDSSGDLYDQVPWKDNLDSVKNFLKQENIKIYDEYNQEYSYEQFWEEIKDILYVSKKNLDHKLYMEKHPDEISYTDSSEYTKDNIRWIKNWFC